MKKTEIVVLFSLLLLSLFMVHSFAAGVSAGTDCWQYSSQSSCLSNQCFWKTSGSNSWCETMMCSSADSNQTLCDALNRSVNGTVKSVTYAVDFTCAWQLWGTNLCDAVGGNSFGDGCSDYNGNENGCYGTFFCIWNATGSSCQEPSGGFMEKDHANPSCSCVTDGTTCTNISGCTWVSPTCGGSIPCCNGNAEGIQCSDLNKSICSGVTFLSTCCAWNGTSCKTTFDQACYNNVPTLSSGKMFCEDYLAANNKTVCEEIAGSPWYMPCVYNKTGDNRCHFNSDAFEGSGGSAQMGEIGTEVGCEAQGGIWQSEQYLSGGTTKTDSWCEFKFGFEFGGSGGAGNCDTACWACETKVSSSQGNTSSQAQSLCQNSALGYCEYRADSNAPNGIGFCNPKQSFIEGGGKSCSSECSACDYLTSPEQKCADSPKSCLWVNDTQAQNGVGNCFGRNEKRCANDCFSCYSATDCASFGDGGAGACNWVNNICQSAGFTGEICFDGTDNDADTKIDCDDSECASDKFCGGGDLSTTFGDCPNFPTNATCKTAGCVWVSDSFDKFFGGGSVGVPAGHCDFPGSQCWSFDDNQTGCNGTMGCSFFKVGNAFCHENSTLFDTCFVQNNQSNCQNIAGCGWTNDTYSHFGRCEPLVFSQCFGNSTRSLNESNCKANVTVSTRSTQICSWRTDAYAPRGGFCEASCFGFAGDTASCETNSNGLCQLQSGFCDPTVSGGKCFEADGNITKCNQDLNSTCTYSLDGFAGNGKNGTLGNISGWCDPEGEAGFSGFLGNEEPVIIGDDANDTTIDDRWDIESVGLRDEFGRMMLGTRLQDKFALSGVCNAVPTYTTTKGLGSGNANHTFFWYLDSDGNTTNNCATRDNSTAVGFDFSFKYKSQYDTTLTETKVSYRCVNGSWTSTPIPLSMDKNKMCSLVGGGMAGIDKTELFKFKGLFNKSKDLRVYATVGNNSTNESVVTDFAGPYYYSQGSVDFKFEDCADSGADADGDGITASSDPDCTNFLKFGYVPNEVGFQCMDGIDNDGDSKVDCSDQGCTQESSCGGSGKPLVDATDKAAPKVTWLEENTFPDAAFINYDTDEPANGTLSFFGNDSACKTINDTVRDVGVYDASVPDYKTWHDAPLDALGYNQESLKLPLLNGTNYYYKTKVCDVNNNCAVTACLNFTTKASASSCKSCSSTFNFPFTPPSGAGATDPLGALNFTMEFQDGSTSVLGANAQAGTQLNYSQTKNFNLLIENGKTDLTNWSVTFINASVSGKLSSSVTNFSATGKSGDMSYNSTANGTYFGLGTGKCQELINSFRPKKIKLGLPGNVSSLYQCNAALTNCTLKSVGTNATSLGYNTTTNVTSWLVPSEWGC